MLCFLSIRICYRSLDDTIKTYDRDIHFVIGNGFVGFCAGIISLFVDVVGQRCNKAILIVVCNLILIHVYFLSEGTILLSNCRTQRLIRT